MTNNDEHHFVYVFYEAQCGFNDVNVVLVLMGVHDSSQPRAWVEKHPGAADDD